MQPIRKRPTVKQAAVIAALTLTALVVTVYLWPLDSGRLQRAVPVAMPFAPAEATAMRAMDADADDAAVQPGCGTQVFTHGRRTARAVLILHGYRSCTRQFTALAGHFFRRGYNVYLPRAPRHGLTDTTAHAGVTAQELVGYADEAMNVAAALGDEVGVVGTSGGAVLATWLAQYRGDVVRRLLLLAPFYRPGPDQAPGFVLKPMKVLFGFRLVPDHINGRGYSYAALAQYMRIVANIPADARNPRLDSIAVVVSPNDTSIDRRLAFELPRRIAEGGNTALTLHTLPAGLGLAHNLTDADHLNPRYAELYEGNWS